MARKPAPRRRTKATENSGWPVWLIAVIGFSVVFFGMTAWYLYRTAPVWITSIQNNVIDISKHAGFRVGDIYIQGRKDLSNDQLLAKVNVERGTPLLAVDTHTVAARLMELPPVHKARVERLWPDRLLVQIQERQPIALWQKDGKLSPIDSDGVVLTYQHADALPNLPIVIGDNAPKLSDELFTAIEHYPELKAQLHAATYVSNRRWDLYLKSGMQIKLPEGDVRAGLKRLMHFADDHLIFAKPIAVVDLRLDDRVVIKPMPAGAPSNQPATEPKPKTQI